MSKFRTDLNPATFGTAPFDRLKAQEALEAVEQAEEQEAEIAQEQADEEFDQALNDATHGVIAEFEFLGLPDDGVNRSDLLAAVNRSLTAIFEDFREDR